MRIHILTHVRSVCVHAHEYTSCAHAYVIWRLYTMRLLLYVHVFMFSCLCLCDCMCMCFYVCVCVTACMINAHAHVCLCVCVCVCVCVCEGECKGNARTRRRVGSVEGGGKQCIETTAPPQRTMGKNTPRISHSQIQQWQQQKHTTDGRGLVYS